MSEEWLERQEGPDGQWCDLVTRIDYKTQRLIEVGLREAQTTADLSDVCLSAMKEACQVKNFRTGEMTDDLELASAAVVQPWRVRAMELYNAWYAEAMPGPKGSSRTASRTQTSGKKRPRSGTSA